MPGGHLCSTLFAYLYMQSTCLDLTMNQSMPLPKCTISTILVTELAVSVPLEYLSSRPLQYFGRKVGPSR